MYDTFTSKEGIIENDVREGLNAPHPEILFSTIALRPSLTSFSIMPSFDVKVSYIFLIHYISPIVSSIFSILSICPFLAKAIYELLLTSSLPCILFRFTYSLRVVSA
jgi:hypothetical protein